MEARLQTSRLPGECHPTGVLDRDSACKGKMPISKLFARQLRSLAKDCRRALIFNDDSIIVPLRLVLQLMPPGP
eukprot:8452126-Pyramimonas_sp.AAC.1